MAASVGAESERWCIVLVVVEPGGSLVLVVEPTRVAVPCPRCGELSGRQHSRYDRHPLDLPWRGKTVRMLVHSRRWFCDVPTCPRKIFAERFDGELARYARRTNGTTDLLTTFACRLAAPPRTSRARVTATRLPADTSSDHPRGPLMPKTPAAAPLARAEALLRSQPSHRRSHATSPSQVDGASRSANRSVCQLARRLGANQQRLKFKKGLSRRRA
jgi:hypothetical protein